MKKITKLMLLMLIGLMLVGCGNKQEKFMKEIMQGHKWGETENQTKSIGEYEVSEFLGHKVYKSGFDSEEKEIWLRFTDDELASYEDSEEYGYMGIYESLQEKLDAIFGSGERDTYSRADFTRKKLFPNKPYVYDGGIYTRWYYDTNEITLYFQQEGLIEENAYSIRLELKDDTKE